MEEKIYSNPSRYRLLNLLGEGLNSCVYRAIKEDEKFGMSQTVAVKILKSEKLVSIWRNEISRISAIRSKYCVGYFGWDVISSKPALVLEYVQGVTLEELASEVSLNERELAEIVTQSYRGLVDLQDAGLFHGDLNFHNIMVDVNGGIKLVDFGVYDIDGSILTTPKYADARILAGAQPTFDTDLYSLRAIALEIANKLKLPAPVLDISNISLCDDVQGEIASKVRKILDKKENRKGFTQKLSQFVKVEWRYKRLSQVAAMLLICYLPLLSLGDQRLILEDTPPAIISVRSKNWLELKINGKSKGYAPLDVEVHKSGDLVIEWVAPSGGEQTVLTVRAGQHIVLDDVFFVNHQQRNQYNDR